MHYLMFGCSLLVLVNLSGSKANFQVLQKPRFYGVKPGKTVSILCSISDTSQNPVVAKWYKAKAHKNEKKPYMSSEARNMSLKISNVQLEDSGIYFCEVMNIVGHGTELQVLRYSNSKKAEQRSKMKDFVIFLQTFLLVLCIVLPLVWHYRLGKKEEAVYEEPERDHTYEGLEIEHCGGDLYEDIRPYCQESQGPEAAWEVGHPGVEPPDVEPSEDKPPQIESPEQE
ncbi:B-cell antigen receptor complex-associated protein beta chain [Colossoma macropomum]|uniref:B-cell antigen receptor complex-associated protein beta chain n=1 Tax=Colossoma macropomum TaxID=42526 RepID=UPI001863EAB5|nr:B-cell antigen receptor complex-associated protein beta chain [Colossoma macropomum]